jgi:hypothetical protein
MGMQLNTRHNQHHVAAKNQPTAPPENKRQIEVLLLVHWFHLHDNIGKLIIALKQTPVHHDVFYQ